ncbi:uncharacterized protein LOC132611914 [Lycium barbarum]|uniref:uncharacterized protein LOC132611914 n=1 Tax=Lycium barbarum TaxID=112863 RepID=UPI00293ED493|nr:uncharacterized protein LOC132611914 [Lycium barbarum]
MLTREIIQTSVGEVTRTTRNRTISQPNFAPEPKSKMEEMMKKMMGYIQKIMTNQQNFKQKIIAKNHTRDMNICNLDRLAEVEKEAVAKDEVIEIERVAKIPLIKQPQPVVAKPPPSFPHRLAKKKEEAKYKKFLDLLKHLHVNVPLVDMLQGISKEANYIKDIVAKKIHFTEYAKVVLTEECTSRIQNKLTTKLKDSDSFTIKIAIGKKFIADALCDLGASINLIPSFMFRKLELGNPRPTTIVLPLAAKSLARPEGIIEDVLVQVGSLIFSVDFVILDFEPYSKVQFILGRPFFATGRELIDVAAW